mmetsp:Transcript_38600/g.46701  ORF Transcript_38600/g.46701 Transcript_38600/m.46701 type:complete len:508 (+) Transcript_38600:312-1835(+)|eukprot:CAMPEP_0197849484 /NCGR_PEP_ID=MMETSP1438-20131217/12299_1 /TAXON_ID=1461541 /ORGANISM="Pterosperma sp., Strain CCMP1384" /LENGTH=507 /DNA_ID=CAMNT_0043462201 /DNA_START=305 /DNA_END=1828 /DNA_ORIENTATION=-
MGLSRAVVPLWLISALLASSCRLTQCANDETVWDPVISGLFGGEVGAGAELNWATNIGYTGEIVTVHSIQEVQEVVRNSTKVKALGSRHSFSRVSDTSEVLISMGEMNRVLEVKDRSVRVEGGITYSQLSEHLSSNGYALKNLASLPHISVAGSIGTATHGSGAMIGNLATAVHSLTIVMADGNVRKFKGDEVEQVVVHLGALGIVVELELETVPTFQIQQCVYTDMELDVSDFSYAYKNMATSAYSISLFTLFKNKKPGVISLTSVWLKKLVTNSNVKDAADVCTDSTLHGAPLTPHKVHPLPDISDTSPVTDMSAASWHLRLPHFTAEGTPSNGHGEELQAEYFINRRFLKRALQLITENLSDDLAPILKISEIRLIKGDNLLMSPCYGQAVNKDDPERPLSFIGADGVSLVQEGACSSIHFTLVKDLPAVIPVLAKVEEILREFKAKPHWGKVFAMSPSEVRRMYGDSLDDFQKLVKKYDAKKKFSNFFLDTFIHSHKSDHNEL